MSSILPKLVPWLIGRTSRLFTKIRTLGEADPTAILVRNRTLRQREAEEVLASNTSATKASGHLLIVIPFRDQWAMTEACLASLARQSLEGVSVEVLLLDNGSTRPETAEGIGRAVSGPTANGFAVTTLRIDEPFNFSRLNNLAVAARAATRPDHLLFLNNDVEAREPTDLSSLLGLAASCPQLGALGCTLVFPDDTVQHLFLAPGVKIVGAHPLKGFRLADDLAWFQTPRAVGAVTGAALLVRADAFAEVGGFDESLPTVGQDLDLCLKLQKSGRTNWVLPRVRMLHKEGASRGKAIAKQEVAYMYAKWGEFLTKNPFYSDRLSRFSEAPAYRLLEPAYPWEKVL